MAIAMVVIMAGAMMAVVEFFLSLQGREHVFRRAL